MKYELIATLGPSSSTPEIRRKMQAAGITAYRVNTSHLDVDQVFNWLELLAGPEKGSELHPPVILDLQGSKWRIGQFERQLLAKDQKVELIFGTSSHRISSIPVPHIDFFKAAPSSSNEIVLNDGRIILALENSGSDRIIARVIRGGELSARKGITYTNSGYRNEELTEKDRSIITATQGIPNIQYALSYLKDSEELNRYRTVLGSKAYVIAKIERHSALEDALNLFDRADALWLCRGDLGAELGLTAMAQAVHNFTRGFFPFKKPVLMAGQVLEHMSQNPQPTRSEICYLLDCLENGYDGFVLSDETAIGQYPVEACEIGGAFQRENLSPDRNGN